MCISIYMGSYSPLLLEFSVVQGLNGYVAGLLEYFINWEIAIYALLFFEK